MIKRIFLAAMAFGLLTFISCDKSDDNAPAQTVTPDGGGDGDGDGDDDGQSDDIELGDSMDLIAKVDGVPFNAMVIMPW